MSSMTHLDLNDCNLQLWRGKTHVQSPGYALLQGEDYTFGNGARMRARLHPRDINTRYWWQLGTAPLQPALGPARHTADLAHQHLLQLHREADEPSELTLAVPGSMTREQLSLLLGIVKQCPFQAVGLVNRSVALGSLCGAGGAVFHLEIQLHQALLTRIDAEGDTAHLRTTTPLPGCGLLQLQERIVELISADFVKQSRFDPRRKAATEQELYDALPGVLQNLRDASECNIEVSGYRARINREDLRAAGETLFASAKQCLAARTAEDRLLADPLTALLPGLADALPGIEILAQDALPTAMRAQQSQIVQRTEALHLFSALPYLPTDTLQGTAQLAGFVQATAVPDQERLTSNLTTQKTEPPTPTHYLQAGRARPLTTAAVEIHPGLSLCLESNACLLRDNVGSATVNDTAHRREQALSIGDVIALDGVEIARLIAVEDD